MPLKQSNKLYLSILPFIRITAMGSGERGQPIPLYGDAQQAVTLFTDPKFATEFFPDEVEGFIDFFLRIAQEQLTGGHVTGYECSKELVENGRVVVKVTQYVE